MDHLGQVCEYFFLSFMENLRATQEQHTRNVHVSQIQSLRVRSNRQAKLIPEALLNQT